MLGDADGGLFLEDGDLDFTVQEDTLFPVVAMHNYVGTLDVPGVVVRRVQGPFVSLHNSMRISPSLSRNSYVSDSTTDRRVKAVALESFSVHNGE